MGIIGPAKTLILFNIFNHKGGFVDDRVLGNAGFKVNLIPGFDKLAQPHGRFDDKFPGSGIFES